MGVGVGCAEGEKGGEGGEGGEGGWEERIHVILAAVDQLEVSFPEVADDLGGGLAGAWSARGV